MLGHCQSVTVTSRKWHPPLSAFPAMAAQQCGAHTALASFLDRSALHGVLAEIEALGPDLLEVRQLEPQRKSPESSDSCSP